jgi:hypothetical protein
MDITGLCLIWSFEHNAWWKPDELGYTEDVLFAGRYSLERAMEICVHANTVALNEGIIPLAPGYDRRLEERLATGNPWRK